MQYKSILCPFCNYNSYFLNKQCNIVYGSMP